MNSLILDTSSVVATVEGRKTRHVMPIKLRDGSYPQDDDIQWLYDDWDDSKSPKRVGKIMDFSKTYPKWQELLPPYKVGQIVPVRETWACFARGDSATTIWYKADKETIDWPPSLFHKAGSIGSIRSAGTMPIEFARIYLEIITVDVKMLSDFDSIDAIDCGVLSQSDKWLNKAFPDYAALKNVHDEYKTLGPPPIGPSPIKMLYALLEQKHGPHFVASNPFLWSFSFKLLSTTGKPK